MKTKTTLTIVALSTPHTISAKALATLRAARRVYVQTAHTPCILPLEEMGLAYTSMDDLYQQAEDFDQLHALIANRLLAAATTEDIVYAVPGGIADGALFALCERARAEGIRVERLAGAGYALCAAAELSIPGPYVIAPATDLPAEPDVSRALFVEEVDTLLRAGEVKLWLMEFYPDTHTVYVCRMNARGAYECHAGPLYELDRQSAFHATTVLAAPPVDQSALERFSYGALVRVMRVLRERCPWDRKQTHASLKKTMVEECYEALDAIDREDDEALAEELGDVLLQCVFHAVIAQEQGRFTHRDMTTAIVSKLIYRHPHIFQADTANSADEVVQKWEELKKKEKHMETQAEVLKSVPKNLPALMRADKVQKKAAIVGFDWDCAAQALDKLEEEARELRDSLSDKAHRAEEMGDLLFAAVNVSRLLGLEPEETLGRAADKFIARFERMERLAARKGQRLEKMPLDEQNALWDVVKNAENGQK